jgi:hypothetical protein
MRAEEKARIEAEKKNAEILVDPDKPFERKEEVAAKIEVKEEVPQTENIEEVKVEEKTEEKKTDAEKIGRGRKKGS